MGPLARRFEFVRCVVFCLDWRQPGAPRLSSHRKDPIEGRLELLGDKATRDRWALEKVAEMANWSGVRGEEGKVYGVALHPSYGGHFAYIAEVTERDREPRVTKVWVASDVGIAVVIPPFLR